MKELTEAEKEWLCDNCGYIKRSEIAKRLNLSSSSLSRLAISLGLRNRYRARSKKKGDSEIVKVKHKNVQKMPAYEEGYEYCLYCSLYRIGGICERDGKPTGALHQKSCFTNEEGTNN